MKSIDFERDEGQRYYPTHYLFFINLARAAGVNVRFTLPPRADSQKGTGRRGFIFKYYGQDVLVDFGDHPTEAEDIDNFGTVFRYHYSKRRHGPRENVFPLTPISFHNWGQFSRMRKKINYRANAPWILNNQRPRHAAVKRRRRAQFILREAFGAKADFSMTGQEAFWRKINNCFLSVCIPGARETILDRGQLQQMAFGCATLSTPLDIVLPDWKEPEPGVHYLTCSPDFSDLVGTIERFEDRRRDLREVGANAARLFQESCMPARVWDWIERTLDGRKR